MIKTTETWTLIKTNGVTAVLQNSGGDLKRAPYIWTAAGHSANAARAFSQQLETTERRSVAGGEQRWRRTLDAARTAAYRKLVRLRAHCHEERAAQP